MGRELQEHRTPRLTLVAVAVGGCAFDAVVSVIAASPPLGLLVFVSTKAGWATKKAADRFVCRRLMWLMLLLGRVGHCFRLLRRRCGGLLLRFGHLDVAQAVLAVYAYEIDIAADAGAMAGLGVLPQREARGWIATVVGYENMILRIFL